MLSESTLRWRMFLLRCLAAEQCLSAGLQRADQWYNAASKWQPVYWMRMTGEKRYRVYVCGGPSCTPRGRDALSKALDEALWVYGLLDDVEVRVSGCQSRCDFAPNITV